MAIEVGKRTKEVVAVSEKKKKTCWKCKGTGTVKQLDIASLILFKFPNEINRTCPTCNGTGEIDDELS